MILLLRFLAIFVSLSDYNSILVLCELSLTGSNFNIDELSLENINKCICPHNQVFQDGSCVDGTLQRIPVWDEQQQIDFLVDMSNFSSITVKELSCSEGYSKVTLSHFVIFTNGSLDNLVLIDEPPTTSYCIEHFQTHEGVAMRAEVCEIYPKIPVCCPANHVLNKENQCIPKLDIKFRPQIVGDFEWTAYNLVEQKIECSETDQLLTIPVTMPGTEGAALVGYPLGGGLEWNSRYRDYNEFKNFEDYCVSISDTESGLYYFAKFCSSDRKTEHERECANSTCVAKCCPEGYVVYEVADKIFECILNENYTNNFTFYKEHGEEMVNDLDLKLVYGFPFCEEFYLLRYQSGIKRRINLQGSLILNGVVEIPSTKYCLDGFLNEEGGNGSVTESGAFCIMEIQRECSWRWIVGSFLLLVSCFFYILTLIVYLTIEELRTRMVGRCLISQVTALFIAYAILIFLQHVNSYETLLCSLPGTIEHITILASFFWLNVMCFDMWRTLRSVLPADDTRENTTKRFVYYSLYAWGIPLLIGIIRIVIDQIPNDDNQWLIKANLGTTHCFLANYSAAKWAYLYGPILVILLINIGFFFHVAVILMKAHRENSRLLKGPNSTKSGTEGSNAKKERAIMYLKLFLVMGISWILEIIMWLSVPESECYFWGFDIVNAFQGIFIFVIFVCKKQTLQKVKAKFFCRVIHAKGIYELPQTMETQTEGQLPS